MDFTYKAYIDLINLLKEKNYHFTNYKSYKEFDKPVIFRHDIDSTLEKAIKLANIEYEANVKSTYFVLLSTNFYNVFSKESNQMLKTIMELGHEIGLHFDEKRYIIQNKEELENEINYEKELLEKAVGTKVCSVSMHIPSKWILKNNIQFKNVINTYSKTFFNEFKYLSDSRMHWREDVLGIINSEKHDKLHILTHPFWYSDKEETMQYKIEQFLNNAKKDRYEYLKDNFTNLDEIIVIGDVY